LVSREHDRLRERRAHDRPAASSSSCVFIPWSDRPSIPARRTPAARGRGGAPAVLSHRTMPPVVVPPQQPPPTPPSPLAIIHQPATQRHPGSVIAFGLLLFFEQLPTAYSTRTQTAPMRGRWKAHGGMHKIYRSKLCYMSSSKMMHY
jgi:hypothetical protein